MVVLCNRRECECLASSSSRRRTKFISLFRFSSFDSVRIHCVSLQIQTPNMSVAILSGKTVQWILRSTNPMRTAFLILPNGSKTLEQKRSVSWYLGKEEHKNFLAQASYFYSNPEYAQWKEKPFRNGSTSFLFFPLTKTNVAVCFFPLQNWWWKRHPNENSVTLRSTLVLSILLLTVCSVWSSSSTEKYDPRTNSIIAFESFWKF